MDVFDQAQQNDELFRQASLRAHYAGRRESGRHPQGAGPDVSRFCSDCGEKIQPSRLKAMPAAVCCADCQGEKERKR